MPVHFFLFLLGLAVESNFLISHFSITDDNFVTSKDFILSA